MNSQTNMFDGVIGQVKTKKKLKFFLKAQHKTGISPNIMFVAPKGCGKTMMAEAYASYLKKRDGTERPSCYLNCSTLKNISEFMERVLIPCTQSERECTIFLDEASEIPRNVTMGLLTMLNPNRNYRNTFNYEGSSFEINFRRTTFLFATTEAHQVFHALMDRLERVDLDEYTSEDLSLIVSKESDLPISPIVMKQLMPIARGNGRDAFLLAQRINNWSLNNPEVTKFGVDQWKDLVDNVSILPLGLNANEVKLLKILAERPVTTLTGLSARTMMSKTSLQKDLELYLQKQNLMEIAPTGRKITEKGKRYLELVKD